VLHVQSPYEHLAKVCYVISEITEKEKEKLIHHMAYQCAPSELPDLNEILKRRRAKKIDIEITPRSRQAECT